MPTWVNGKYLWTRDKIVYTNPASTDYTTPVVSSEWEAVNEIEVGARNLWIKSASINSYSGNVGAATSYLYNQPDDAVPSKTYFSFQLPTGTGTAGPYFTYPKNVVTLDRLQSGETYTISFYIKASKATTINIASTFENQTQIATSSNAVGTTWTRLWATYRWTNTSKNTVCFYATKDSSEAITVSISSIKIEKGNVVTDWTPAPEDTSGSIYIVGTQTAAGAAWTGTTSEISTLTAGTQILYKLPYAGAANVTLNLTLADGTTTGAKNCYYKYSGTRLSTQYPANSMISMIYDGTQWIVTNPYTNDNTYDRTRYNNNIKAAAAITADRLIVGTSAGYVQAAAGISFDINYPVLWASSQIAAAGTGTNNYLTLPSRSLKGNYSSVNLTQYKMAYIKGTLSGNIFTIDTAVFSNEPTTEDGKYYIPIGILYSTYQVYFDCGMPTVYKYYDGAFRPLPRT